MELTDRSTIDRGADVLDSSPTRRTTRITHRWPTVVGVVFAGFVALGATAAEVAPVVTASAFVYLGAAALHKRAAAWPMFFVSFVVIAVGNIAGLSPVWPTAAMLGIGIGLSVYGLVRHGSRPAWGVPLQAAAMALLAPAAIIAVAAGATWAGLLVSAGLFAHAGWDIYHHRAQKVVSRSMAEFCAVLDTLVAVSVLVVTFTS